MQKLSFGSSTLHRQSIVLAAALRFAWALLLGLAAIPVGAAPFAKHFQFTQPGGAHLMVWGEGDEFQAVFETLDGYTVVFDPAKRAYYYATLGADGKSLVSAGVLANDVPPPSLSRHIRADRAVVAAEARVRQAQINQVTGLSRRWSQLKLMNLGNPGLQTDDVPLPEPPSAPTLGTKLGLTLLIDFPDVPATISQSQVNAFCNGNNYVEFGNNGSVKQYFSDVSGGRLTYSNVVTLYVRMALPKAYYNDTSRTCGFQGRLLIGDALAILKARSDYATSILPTFNNLTVDGWGNVVAFNVLFAGDSSGVWSYGLWPHSWSLENPTPLGNGKSVFGYQITDISNSLELGTFCHENGHMLCGFPDIYDYDYDSVGGAGVFCLMNYGGSGPNPKQVCAYLKLAAGWANVTDLDSTSNLAGTLVAAPNEGYNSIYRFRRPGVATEYFLLENRQPVGRDAGLPGGGIAVWHVDELGDKDIQNLLPNSAHENYEVTLVQADNQWHFQNNLNAGDAFDLYQAGNSSIGYANRLDDASNPHAHWWDGSHSGMSLSSFGISGPVMRFTVGAGGLPSPVLSAEPAVTAGTENQITWSAVTPDAAPAIPSGIGMDSVGGLDPATSPDSPSRGVELPGQDKPVQQTIVAQDYKQRPLPLGPNLEWRGITSEGFEAGFPSVGWEVLSAPGEPTWDDTAYAAHSGSRSAWCAGSTRDPSGGYPNDANAWMVYGPFSLADAISAHLGFWFKNYSEYDYDFLGWYASVDGSNFYGNRVSGDQNSWRQQLFDLTDVYTLGNLCGSAQVWIAFIFSSDGSITGPGAFVDDVVLRKDVPTTPDLTPFQPPLWNDRLPISPTQLAGTAAHTYSLSGPFYDNQLLFVNWASANQGMATAAGYTVRLEVGGSGWNWANLQTDPGSFATLANDFAVGPLAAGNHTFKLWVDYLGEVNEFAELNNYYERTITIKSTAPVEYYAQCADNSGFTSPRNSGWITELQYRFGGLTPGQTYWYRVKARQGALESPWSNVEFSQQAPAVGCTLEPLLTSFTPGTLRNDMSGWRGHKFRVGTAPLEVHELGRIYLTGNAQTHELRLVRVADKSVVASVAWTPAGGINGSIKYVPLAAPVSLAANAEYFLVSRENNRGDQLCSFNTAVVTTAGASVLSAIYSTDGTTWNIPSTGAGSYSYGPVGLKYCSAPQTEIVMDNASSSGVSYAGTWSASTSTPGYWAADYRHDGNTGKATKAATFTPNLPSPGTYQVFIWYPSRSDYAANVPIEVAHADGVSTMTLNQRVNGGKWNSLGSFNFEAGTAGYVRIRTTGTTGYVTADAVKFVSGGTPLPEVSVVATDATAGEPGTAQGGGTFTFSRTGPTDAALTVNLTVGGSATSGADYTPLPALVTFPAASATVTATVVVSNDSITEPDETITVTLGSGSGYRVGAPSAATVTIKDDDAEIIVDNASRPEVVYVGTWATSTTTPGYWAGNYSHDGNTGKGSKTVTFTPNLPSSGTYQVFIWYPSRSDYAASVPVDIAHAEGTSPLTINQRLNGGRWNLLGSFNFNAGTSGYVRLRTTGTSGYVTADAVKWVLAPAPVALAASSAALTLSHPSPPALNITQDGNGDLFLEWLSVVGNTYAVQRSVDAGVTWVPVAEQPGNNSIIRIHIERESHSALFRLLTISEQRLEDL